MPSVPSIALIGFGEAGQAFSWGWRQENPGLAIRAFDIKTDDPGMASGKRADFTRANVDGYAQLAGALRGANVVLSVVTADQTLAAARAAARHVARGTLYLDGNSCAPETKRAAAAVIEAAGADYVDMAIMAPVQSQLHKVPLLLAGEMAGQAVAVLNQLGANAQLAGDKVGLACSVKMLRSVMIKGLEALTLECLLAARRAGVEPAVLDSLDASFPGWNWPTHAAYMMERATTHGTRRAAEMREVTATVLALGLPARMSAACAQWQAETGALTVELTGLDVAGAADEILAALAKKDKKEGEE